MACSEAARLTGGTYHAVERPADVVSLLPKAPVSRVELVAVRSPQSGSGAQILGGDPAAAAKALVEKLRNEARVL